MFATLSEAFGQNYDEYPPSDLQQKRKKKNIKGKNYGCEVPNQSRFSSPEPKKELNLTIGGYPEDDDNYLKISNENEYGPTDYNIKPKDIEEYTYQMKKNYIDDNTNTSIINRKLTTPSASNDPNMVDDNFDNYAMFKKMDKNKSMNSFNNLDMNVDISDEKENENENKKTGKSMKYDPRLADFNAKLDLILQKLGHMEEPIQENIHDIILFVIFGVFVIFILDSVYRVGKMTL